ncbi:MAG: flagellar biosynthesis protein FlhB [Chloroflexi bacterium]|nr:flagellar biosynthesis protein FlhB [Chloroflexota bacterium]
MAGEERTEAATPRKLQHLRDEGKVNKSSEVIAAASILTGVGTLYTFGGFSWSHLRVLVTDTLSNLNRGDFTDATMMQLWFMAGLAFFTVMAPLLVAMPVMGIISNVGQSGFLLSTKSITPDFSRINPISGFTRLFSLRIAVELLKTTIKVGVVGWLLYRTYVDSFPLFLSLAGADLAGALALFVSTMFSTALTVGGAFLVLAVLDYGYQRWEFLRGARMTKQEMKEEYKQSEGSPEIKNAIRRRQRRMAMSRMMQNVPTADVVVTNPTHFAVALRYRGDEMAAPKVIAKGKDLIAQRIKQIARENNVPVVENKPLARALFAAVEVDQEIPYDLFQGVAQILAYIYSLKRRPSASHSARAGA